MNSCTFSGFLSKDPESNNGVVKFSIAQNENYNGKESTTWLNFTAFKKAGESAAQMQKGDFVTVNGKYQTNEHEGKIYPGFIVFSLECPEMWKRRKANVGNQQQGGYQQGPPQGQGGKDDYDEPPF
jgi:single-stranded DNA-binding protein